MTEQQPDQQDAPAKMGRGMMTIAWIIALGLLTLYFTHWQEKQYNPNGRVEGLAQSGVNEVRLQRNRQHHYVATGLINETPVTFLVDTGATHVAVPAHISDKLGLKRGAPGLSITANGTVQTYSTVIDKLQLGTIVLDDVRASINPGMQQNEILLGMSALKNVEFSSRDGVLTLRQYP